MHTNKHTSIKPRYNNFFWFPPCKVHSYIRMHISEWYQQQLVHTQMIDEIMCTKYSIKLMIHVWWNHLNIQIGLNTTAEDCFHILKYFWKPQIFSQMLCHFTWIWNVYNKPQCMFFKKTYKNKMFSYFIIFFILREVFCFLKQHHQAKTTSFNH